MSSKIYNILRRYHIYIKPDNQRKCSNLNWLIFIKFLSMEMMNKTRYVLEIYNAKCYKLLMSSVFVVWLLNDINELELSFL